MKSIGHITQIISVIVDVVFEDNLPEIYNALEVQKADGSKIILEVQQHLGNHQVRAIAMGTTDGLKTPSGSHRYRPSDLGSGRHESSGRLFNVLGETIDNGKPITDAQLTSIHTDPPKFTDIEARPQMLETGIKVIDLICPFAKRRQSGRFRRRRRR